MKMQRTTALRLKAELTSALDADTDQNIISLPDSVNELLRDVTVRDELADTIDLHSSE